MALTNQITGPQVRAGRQSGPDLGRGSEPLRAACLSTEEPAAAVLRAPFQAILGVL